MTRISSYRELEVFKNAFAAAMTIYEKSKSFPTYERFSLTDQVRRSSRSVCTSIGEAWKKRSYPAHFVSKLGDAESEAEETKVWIDFAAACGYLGSPEAIPLQETYDHVGRQLATMIHNPDDWTI